MPTPQIVKAGTSNGPARQTEELVGRFRTLTHWQTHITSLTWASIVASRLGINACQVFWTIFKGSGTFVLCTYYSKSDTH
jgi:hypothetical protein